ncbi:VTT domain-containing protein [Francisella frigiditurris]|uniref:VTT domain-containing protein n=1 Tax=Francisella frigiditurris TaxID=1542390 RepID=A0A1J0KRD3_9GAMM|nr:VTT domain-containing protein [Francisella frigiditurris]APC96305.1 hypothetical protein KX01_1090 [Francisella frigiditurris]
MLDMIIHLNSYIDYFINTLGPWFYVLLFIVIFCETGIVFGLLFPGDSLLFAIGVTAAATSINIHTAIITICIAAIAGDSFNYITGKLIGEKIFTPDAKILKASYLKKTNYFFNKYGGKTIIFARFIAFVRTLAPFVAGVSRMNYAKFVLFGTISAILWSCSITYIAFFLSENQFVKRYLSLIIICIVGIVIIHYLIKIFLQKLIAKK